MCGIAPRATTDGLMERRDRLRPARRTALGAGRNPGGSPRTATTQAADSGPAGARQRPSAAGGWGGPRRPIRQDRLPFAGKRPGGGSGAPFFFDRNPEDGIRRDWGESGFPTSELGEDLLPIVPVGTAPKRHCRVVGERMLRLVWHSCPGPSPAAVIGRTCSVKPVGP